MKKLSFAAAMAVLVAVFAVPAPARTVPNWFWRWQAWMEHGQQTRRPAAVPKRIPRWAWRMLAENMRGLHKPKPAAAAPASTTTAPASPATTAPSTPTSTATTTTAPPATTTPPPTTTAAPPATTTASPPPTTTPTTTAAPPPPTTTAAPPPTTTTTPPPTSGLNAAEQSLLDAVNQSRAQNGLRPLSIDTRLEQAARDHTQDLLANNAFTHDFIKNGTSYPFGTWIGWYYTGVCAGENLAEGLPALSAAGAVQLWLNSPGHRANMLSSSYTTVGVELAGNGGTTIATTDFGGC